jgi:hypothetical protein
MVCISVLVHAHTLIQVCDFELTPLTLTNYTLML